MGRLDQAIEKATKIRRFIKGTFAEETNTTEHVVCPTRKISNMIIGLILPLLASSLLLFPIINYLVLRNLTENLPTKSTTSIHMGEFVQQVQPQISVLTKETVSLYGVEDTNKEIKEKTAKPQKSSNDKFTIQVGAFRNLLYARTLAARLNEKGYKVYIDPAEEKDKKLFKVCVGTFANKHEAQYSSKEIKINEDLQPIITLTN